jgi:diguanylate cyclase (GGDEF)-like protein/PAS domain S-box-containing protein
MKQWRVEHRRRSLHPLEESLQWTCGNDLSLLWHLAMQNIASVLSDLPNLAVMKLPVRCGYCLTRFHVDYRKAFRIARVQRSRAFQIVEAEHRIRQESGFCHNNVHNEYGWPMAYSESVSSYEIARPVIRSSPQVTENSESLANCESGRRRNNVSRHEMVLLQVCKTAKHAPIPLFNLKVSLESTMGMRGQLKRGKQLSVRQHHLPFHYYVVGNEVDLKAWARNSDESLNPTSSRARAFNLETDPTDRALLQADPETTRSQGSPFAPELLVQISALHLRLKDAELSRDQYQHLYDFAPIGYLIVDERNMISGANLTGAGMLGRERDDIVGMPFSMFVVADDGWRYEQMVERAMRSDLPQRLDVGLVRGDQSIFQAQLDYLRVAVDEKPSAARITFVDISERKAAEAEIKHLAFYDPLTLLPNRRLLLDRLQHALLTCARTHNHGAIFFIDLDDFKNLNDTQGHAAGDLLLQEVAIRLKTCIRDSDTVARLGGDEFVVLIEQLSPDVHKSVEQARIIGEKILGIFSEQYQLGTQEHRFTGSVGITLFKDDHESITDLMKRADLALYRAKSAGRSTMRLFDPEMEATVQARGVLDADLRRGLHEVQFVLYYQPQVDANGCVLGVEGLLRWQHPLRGLITPENFISFAEEKGLIGLIGQCVLKQACAQLNLWSCSPQTDLLKIAINVSAHEIAHPQFVTRVLKIIDAAGADARKLVFEFTESVMLGSITDTLGKMLALKERGICFALDDFGVGHSSLSYLQKLPLDQLKIDRSFVRDVLTNPNDAAIARSVIALGNSLGINVIAEGVETEEQRQFLADLGCSVYQGYLFGRPVRAQHLEP